MLTKNHLLCLFDYSNLFYWIDLKCTPNIIEKRFKRFLAKKFNFAFEKQEKIASTKQQNLCKYTSIALYQSQHRFSKFRSWAPKQFKRNENYRNKNIMNFVLQSGQRRDIVAFDNDHRDKVSEKKTIKQTTYQELVKWTSNCKQAALPFTMKE